MSTENNTTQITYKAGFIPYYEGEIMVRKSSDPEYGGPDWCIAKGFIDSNENAYSAAIREAKEELGVKIENIKENTIKKLPVRRIKGLAEWYELHVWIGEIIDPTDFDLPDYETAETKWMTPSEFLASGNENQKIIIKDIALFLLKIN